jgi:hypothetical protein
MRNTNWVYLPLLIVLIATHAAAGTISYTGTLASPESVEQFSLVLPAAGFVTLQTYGFGGGTNAAGAVIPSGGMDPFLAIFSGTGDPATIVTDGSGNPYGTSLTLTNYGDFLGCPPAGAPVIGSSAQCGDIRMSLFLAAGTYTVVLSDGQYTANAVYDNGTLGEGFTDLTGGVFCNASVNGVDCPNTSGAYALDITTEGRTDVVPEPSAITLVQCGLLGWGVLWWRRRRDR